MMVIHQNGLLMKFLNDIKKCTHTHTVCITLCVKWREHTIGKYYNR